MTARPAVSVVVPFLGDASAARRLLDQLGRLALGTGDEVVVADNTGAGTVPEPAQGHVRVVAAAAERSAFHARNVGAEAARNDWLLFIDADCRPAPDLLDAYFAHVAEEACGVLAGAVAPLEAQPGLIPGYARSRNHLSEEFHLQERPEWPHPSGITGNMLVRRQAWEEVGGFQEGLRAGADIEFCWRVQDAGWSLRHVPGAAVEHAHVESLRAMLRQASGHAAGMQWVNRRYPGSYPRPRLSRQLGRSAAGSLVWALTGRGRRSLYKLIDGAWSLAYAHGYLVASNRARRLDEAALTARSVLLAEEFPSARAGGTATEAPADRAEDLRVEALARPSRLERSPVRRLPITYAEDDSPLARATATLWVLARHPLRCARAPRRAAGDPGTRLAVLAPAARRCAGYSSGRLIVGGEARTPVALERLATLAAGQSARTRWRSDPRAEV